MSQHITGEQPQPHAPRLGDLADEVTRLAESVQMLTARIAAFETAIAACITTRRLEVVDADGVPRVVASADDRRCSLEVRTTSAPPHSTSIELVATEADLDDGAHVGLELVDSGDVVAALAVFERAPPTLWLATDGDHPAAG